MPFIPPPLSPRCGVVDLGSNSVRLVVYEGNGRNPMPIFNEKAVLRLGRGMQATGRLNEEAVAQAFTVMHRYQVIAREMGAQPFEVVATAAVRDAQNGQAFIEMLRGRLPGVPIHVLSGHEEAAYSADGMLCGIPLANGLLADIGGGSLELVQLTNGTQGRSETLRLGVIRLSERAYGDPSRAKDIAEADLQSVSWLTETNDTNLYLVGGAWRALARVHIAQTNYPLAMVHHYTIDREAARNLTGWVSSAPRKVLERLPGAPRRRLDDLPIAAVVLRRLLSRVSPQRIIFSASGLREGWFMRRLPREIREQDPLIRAAWQRSAGHGRDPALPPALIAWTRWLFPRESEMARRLREALCWMSDIGSHDHPEFRAEQAFLRVLRQPGVALDHQSRAFLALGVALRYEADLDASFLRPARLLLDMDSAKRAEILGISLRLAYTLSGGTKALLDETHLRVDGPHLTLKLRAGSGVFAGESISRRLERLATAQGLIAVVEDHR